MVGTIDPTASIKWPTAELLAIAPFICMPKPTIKQQVTIIMKHVPDVDVGVVSTLIDAVNAMQSVTGDTILKGLARNLTTR